MIVLASDHRGYALKKMLTEYLKEKDIEFVDVGTDSEESTDFPLYAKKGALKVLEDKNNIGVFICYSGNGMVMASNRFKGIRASLCTEEKWTILASNDSATVFNVRVGNYVQEYKHGQEIILAEGDEICPTSTTIILR